MKQLFLFKIKEGENIWLQSVKKILLGH